MMNGFEELLLPPQEPALDRSVGIFRSVFICVLMFLCIPGASAVDLQFRLRLKAALRS